MERLQEGSPTAFRLAMVSRKTKTLIRPDELSVELEVDDDMDDCLSNDAVQLKNSKRPTDVLVAATSSTIMALTVLTEMANAEEALPSVSASLPSVSAPLVPNIPSVNLPSVSLPSVSVPNLPSVSVPPIPSVNLPTITIPKEMTQSFDPSSFVPVCSTSDSFYRVLQSIAQAVVGPQKFVEYGPLIASGLLRIRLELCVVESFFNEAVGPFIGQNGIAWVLPLHETVETFLAGTVFALATTFILVGSTKILTVIVTYVDFFIGGPLRLFGGFFFDRARGKPVVLDVGVGPFKTRVIGPKDFEVDKKSGRFDFSVNFGELNPVELPVVIVSGGVKFAGQSIRVVRDVLDAIDLFVGKSLILWVTAYIAIKFLHFKVFPDFP